MACAGQASETERHIAVSSGEGGGSWWGGWGRLDGTVKAAQIGAYAVAAAALISLGGVVYAAMYAHAIAKKEKGAQAAVQLMFHVRRLAAVKARILAAARGSWDAFSAA